MLAALLARAAVCCRQKGYINLSTYLTTYKLGDYVDIKVNGAVHKVRRRGAELGGRGGLGAARWSSRRKGRAGRLREACSKEWGCG